MATPLCIAKERGTDFVTSWLFHFGVKVIFGSCKHSLSSSPSQALSLRTRAERANGLSPSSELGMLERFYQQE